MDRKGRDLWQNTSRVIQLWRCHRQASDAEYAHWCLRLRDGTFTENDWKKGLQKDLTRGSLTEEARLQFEAGTSMELVGTNARCGLINGRRAVQLLVHGWTKGDEARGIYRFDAEQSDEVKRMTASKFSGLRSTTHIMVDAEQMLTINVNPELGLANGTIGTTVAVVDDPNGGRLPKCVIMCFPTYTGPELFHVKNDELGNSKREKWVPIFPQTRGHEDKPYLTRTQLPLKLCWAITINKSQGISLDRPTTIDLSPTTPTSKYQPLMVRGMAFTGVTRVTSGDLLAFRNFPNFDQFQRMMSTPAFRQRVSSDHAMRRAHIQTMQELFSVTPEQEEEMHRKWDASRNVSSTWTPPSQIDKDRLPNSKSTPAPQPPVGTAIFSEGDAVWANGKPAVVVKVIAVRDAQMPTTTYTCARPSPSGVVTIEECTKLRKRYPTKTRAEIQWMDAARKILEAESGVTPAQPAPGSQSSSTVASAKASAATTSASVASPNPPDSTTATTTAPSTTAVLAQPSSAEDTQKKRLLPPQTTPPSFRPLPNIGWTCYLNAAIQVIRAMDPLSARIAEHVQQHNNRQHCVTCALHHVVASDCDRDQCALKLRYLLKAMSIFPGMECGEPGEQRDAGEVFLLLLEEIRKATSKTTIGIPGIYGGSLKRNRRCLECGTPWQLEPIETSDNGWLLQLENPHAEQDVMTMLQHMQQEETLTIHCEACRKSNAPHMRRWLGLVDGWELREQYAALQIRKSTPADCMRTHIFPPELVITHHGQTQSFHAIAMICHHGDSITSGHYTARAQDVDGRWWLANDIEVGTSSWNPQANPYMVFYRRSSAVTSAGSHGRGNASSTNCTLLSWNLNGLAYSLIKTNAIIKAVFTLQPTICLCQEVTNQQCIALRDALADAYCIHAPDIQHRHMCFLAVSRQVEVTDVQWTKFSSTTDGRGFMTATVHIGRTNYFTVLTTHLESGVDNSAKRRDQFADILSQSVDLIAGDLNLRDDEAEASLTNYSTRWRDAWEEAGRPASHQYTWDAIRNPCVPRTFWTIPRHDYYLLPLAKRDLENQLLNRRSCKKQPRKRFLVATQNYSSFDVISSTEVSL